MVLRVGMLFAEIVPYKRQEYYYICQSGLPDF